MAFSLTVTMSSKFKLPLSIRSIISSIVIILVTLAIGRCSSAFCSYKTFPVDASIRIDDFTSGVKFSAKQGIEEIIKDKSITDLSITHSFFQPQETEGMNGNDERNRIKNQIEYDCMAERYSKRQLDELVEIMLEVAMKQTIRASSSV